MVELTFEELVAEVQKLPPAQKKALVKAVQGQPEPSLPSLPSLPTQEEIIAELAALRAVGVFDHPVSLFDKYKGPNSNISEEELLETIHRAATEWESELDEFFAGKD